MKKSSHFICHNPAFLLRHFCALLEEECSQGVLLVNGKEVRPDSISDLATDESVSLLGRLRLIAGLLSGRWRSDQVVIVTLRSALLVALPLMTRRMKPLVIASGIGQAIDHPSSFARYVIRTTLALILKGRSVVAVQNEADGDRMSQELEIERSEIKNLGPVSLPEEMFRRYKVKPLSAPRVVYLGRLLHSKGVLELAEACRQARVLGAKVELHLGGSPDTRNPTCLSADELESLREMEHVTLHGELRDTTRLLATATVAAMASKREGMSRFLLEAAAHSVPMVAWDVPGCADVIVPSGGGVAVAQGDTVKMAEAIAGLVLDADAHEVAGKSAYAWAREELSDESFRSRYRRVLAS